MLTKIGRFIHLCYLYIVTRILYIFKKPPKVMNSFDSLKYIINNEVSVSRFGDGEFDIINGKSIKFQKFDKKLSKKLREILFSQEKDIAICIPAIYKFKITRSLKYNEELFWLVWMKRYHNIYLNKEYKNKVYYDACITRPYIRYKNPDISKDLFSMLSRLWEKRDLIIVEGKYSRLGYGNDLFKNAKSLKRIICPNKDAFFKYDEILNSVKKHYKNQLILIALGPTATVLAYDLAKSGIRAIDLGHLDLEYEWFLENAKEKKLVKNKIVNEVNEESKLEEIKDKKYLDSILEEIKV